MKNFWTRLVDLREGEGRPVFQAFIVLFGLIAAHTMLETARDAMFLTKLPPSMLAWVYVLLAGLSLIVAAYNERFVRRFGRRNALIFTLVGSGYGTAMLHFLPQTAAVVFAIYVWSGLLGTVLIVQFWLFAGQLFTVAQGKRLFGPIAAGGVLGAVFGASSAAGLLMVWRVKSLLLVSAGIMIITCLLLTTVATDETRPPATLTSAGTPGATKGRYSLLRDNPYVLRMAAVVGLSTAAVLTTDYLFKTVAAAAYPPRELAQFFAVYYAILNSAALVVQVLLSGPLVRRLGVVAAAGVLPLLLLGGGAAGVALGGVAWLVLLTKGADGALRHSLHRVTSELLGMPLPTEVRERSKTFMETVLSRGVQALTASTLFGISAVALDAAPRVLAGVVAVLALGWFALTMSMRRPYLDLFRQALSRGSNDVPTQELDLNSVEAVMEALSSREPPRVVGALDLLVERGRTRLVPGLILYHESEEVLLRALEVVPAADRSDWVPLTERLLAHPSDLVRVAAVRALARHHPEAVMRAQSDPSAAVRAHATFCRLQADDGIEPLQDLGLVGLLSLGGEEGRAARLALLDAIRDSGDARWTETLVSMSESADPTIVPHAAMAMQRVQNPRFIPFLVKQLSVREGRGTVREAIVQHGDAAFDELERVMRDPRSDPRVRLHIPRTISRFGNQRAADLLGELLAREPSGVVRYKVLRGLGRLVAENRVTIDAKQIGQQTRKNLVEYLRLLSLELPITAELRRGGRGAGSGSLVVGLLDDKMRQSLDRAFRLLQILHKNEDIRSVHLALASKDKRVRANAVEFLDALAQSPGTPEGSREIMRLIADEMTSAERVARATPYIPRPPSTYQSALRRLLREKDASLAALAAYHALELEQDALREEVDAAVRERPALALPGMPPLSRRGAEVPVAR
ncbi:MAG: MFS transporter [Polyangiaceae bacterium]